MEGSCSFFHLPGTLNINTNINTYTINDYIYHKWIHISFMFFTMACTYLVEIILPTNISALEIWYIVLLKINALVGNNFENLYQWTLQASSWLELGAFVLFWYKIFEGQPGPVQDSAHPWIIFLRGFQRAAHLLFTNTYKCENLSCQQVGDLAAESMEAFCWLHRVSTKEIKGVHYVSIHNFTGQMESTLKDPWHLKPDYQKFQTLKPLACSNLILTLSALFSFIYREWAIRFEF